MAKKTTKKIKKKAKKEKKKTVAKVVKKSKVVKKKTPQKKKEVKKKFMWYLPVLVVFILFISFTSFLFFLFSSNYKNWERDFENSGIEIFDYQNEELDLEEKILEYNKAQGQYAFIEFTRRESLFLFSNSLDESLPEWIRVEKTALETSSGNWRFFVKSKIGKYSLPWLQISLSKENIQSVDVYIEDMFLGDLSFQNLRLGFVVENANRGLSRAIQLVNDGNFAGRVFENIELAENSLIIRSRNITVF